MTSSVASSKQIIGAHF